MTFNHHIHPEFGYFCPTPRLRRDVRVAFFAIIFGALIGSATVAALSIRARNADPESAALANPRLAGAATRSDRKQGSRGIEALAGTATATKSQVVDDQASTADPLVPSTVKSEKAAANVNACEEKSSLTAQDHCRSEKFGPVKLRSVNNAPDIARLPLGRPTALEGAAPMGAPGDTGSAKLQLPTPQVAHPAATTSPPAGVEDAPREGLHSPSASPKKPHKIARAQKRHHSERSERVTAVRRGWESDFGAPGRAYARDSSYASTRGFWVWSW